MEIKFSVFLKKVFCIKNLLKSETLEKSEENSSNNQCENLLNDMTL